MTNKEKYIDNASNEELANLLANKCIVYKNKIATLCLDEIEGAVRIENWLSQEAKEEKTCGNCKFHMKVKPCIGAIDKKCVNPKSESCGTYIMSDCSCDVREAKESWEMDDNHTQAINLPTETKKIELTEQAYKDILERLGKLEYYKNTYLELFKQMDDSWKDHCKATHNIQLSGYSYGSIEKEKTAYQMFEELGYKINKEYETPTTILYDNAKEDKQIIIDKVSLHFAKRNKENMPMLITEAEDKAIHKKISELKEEWKNGQ